VNWQFTAGDARIKLARLYPSIDTWHDTSFIVSLSFHGKNQNLDGGFADYAWKRTLLYIMEILSGRTTFIWTEIERVKYVALR
jgi:hypothetical protein